MKCANCGAELQVGSVYCSVCGEEAQIVSDYSILEDDLLREMLNGEGEGSNLLQKSMRRDRSQGENLNGKADGSQDGNIRRGQNPAKAGQSQGTRHMKNSGASAGKSPKDTKNGSASSGKNAKDMKNGNPPSGKNAKEPKKGSGSAGKGQKGKKKPIGWAVAAILLMVFLLVDIVFMVNHSRNNSYDYQMGQAEKHYNRRDYENAQAYLLRAVELSDGDMEADLLLGKVYQLQGMTEKAIETLQKVIQFDKKCQEAYEQLIQIYEAEEDYDAIYKLCEDVDDEDILQLFEEYQVDPPEFIQEEGIHDELVSIEISSQPGCTVLYTTDGSDPRQGLVYQEPIQLEPESNVRIRAVSRNEYGVYSEETEGSFQIDLPKPEMPRVTPMGGNFYEPQAISVYVPDGCNVYYTWDGSVPSEASNHYMGPIEMPEGNNILSLVLVDEYGRYSDVLKCNFIYYP